jgi:ribonuclease HI
MEYDLYTDGSAAHHPTMGITERLGSWAYALNVEDEEIQRDSGATVVDNRGSARMELMAVVRSLEQCEDGSHTRLHCDNLYVRGVPKRIAFEMHQNDPARFPPVENEPNRRALRFNKGLWLPLQKILSSVSVEFLQVVRRINPVKKHEQMHALLFYYET